MRVGGSNLNQLPRSVERGNQDCDHDRATQTLSVDVHSQPQDARHDANQTMPSAAARGRLPSPLIPAAESALGSHPCVALSSAQVTKVYR